MTDFLRRECALSLFAYIYGEPLSGRITRLSLIQFTDTEMKLDFENSIGDQAKQYLLSHESSTGILYTRNEYYRKLLTYMSKDNFFNTLYLEFNFQNKLGGECYIFRQGRDRYIVFRGSDTISDYVIDATIKVVPFIVKPVLLDTSVNVHSGFLSQLSDYSFIAQIAKSIQIDDEDANLYICGHSLGGALALLQSYYLHEIYKGTISVVTFGAPVVGPSSWVDKFNSIFCDNPKRVIQRVCNEPDFIPNLHLFVFKQLSRFPFLKLVTTRFIPPFEPSVPILFKYLNAFTWDYNHVGNDVWIIKPNKSIVKATTSDRVPDITEFFSIADTHMTAYNDWLTKA